jgi:ribosome-associated protein
MTTERNETISDKVIAGRDISGADKQGTPESDPSNSDGIVSDISNSGGISGDIADSDSISVDIANSLAIARRIAEIIDDKMGRDIVILDISRQSSFADFFVNTTAANTRMLATIKDEIDNELEKCGFAVKGTEGKPETGWVLVDCGDVIVNLFLEEQREKYQIEKIWSDAIKVEI